MSPYIEIPNRCTYPVTGDVLCGFYAFQANKKKGNGVPTYSNAEESARRMLIFARSVQEVLHINNQYEMGEITWAASEFNTFNVADNYM